MHAPIVKHAKTQAIIEESTLTTLVERALIAYLPKETITKKQEIKTIKKVKKLKNKK